MTLLQLQCFYNVALHKSITKTADILFLTQPSVSKHIANLEQEFGFPLFIRSTKGVSLTRGGQQIFQHCQIVFEQINHINNTAERVREHEKSHNLIHISCVPTLHLFGLVPFFGTFMNQHPDYDIIMEEVEEDRALFNLRSSICDIAFCSDINDLSDKYARKKVVTEGFSVLVSKKYAEAIQLNVTSIKDLKNIPLIIDKPESNLYQHCLNACRAAGFEPLIRFTSSRSLMAAQYILNDNACYLGFDSAVKYAATEKHILFKIKDIATFNFCLYWDKHFVNPALKYFLEYINKNLHDYLITII